MVSQEELAATWGLYILSLSHWQTCSSWSLGTSLKSGRGARSARSTGSWYLARRRLTDVQLQQQVIKCTLSI